MKYLKRYNEARELITGLKVLDNIIDNDGKLANRKGYIINVKRGKLTEIIVDDEWSYDTDESERNIEHEYIGGIDKNGFLVGFNFDDNQLLNFDGEIVRDELGDPWKRNKDPKSDDDTHIASRPEYNDLISTEGTGWVNVKIDMEVIKKVKRFSISLAKGGGLSSFKERLEKLNNPLDIKANDDDGITQVIQQKISSIMLLKYLQEMKDSFNPTSAGFLFESFIGGLIGGTVPDDNKKADVIGDNGFDTYQIKFVDWGADKGNIKLDNTRIDAGVDAKGKPKKEGIDHRLLPKDTLCDYYIIGLKQPTKVYIYILDSSLPDTDVNSLGKYLVKSGISISKIKLGKPFILDIANLNNKLESISKDLRESLNDIWENLSGIEYNIETITTGVDKDHTVLKDDSIDGLFEDSTSRLIAVNDSLEKLRGSMGDF